MKIFKHLIGVCVFLLIVVSCVFAQEEIKIGIVRQIDIKPFMDAEQGIIESLAARGYAEDRVEFIVKRINNNLQLVKSAVEELKTAGVQVIVSIGTRATIEVLKYVKEIPVVYSGVSYQESIQEAAKKYGYADNYTGTLLNAPAERLIEVALKIKRINRIGMIFNLKEDNAYRDVQSFERSCKIAGIQSVVMPYTQEEDLAANFHKLIELGISCILFPKDTLQVKHIDELIPMVYKHDIFTLGADAAFCQKNAAVLAFTAPAYKVGALAGKKIAQILEGKDPKKIPAEGLANFEIWINLKVAKQTNIHISPAVMRMASEIVQ